MLSSMRFMAGTTLINTPDDGMKDKQETISPDQCRQGGMSTSLRITAWAEITGGY